MALLTKEKKRALLILIAPRLIYILLWILYACTRHRFFITPELAKESTVGAFWHGEFLMLPFIYKQIQKGMSKERNKGYYIIASHHFDALLMVKLCELFGLQSLRGSSTKGGLRVLIESLRLLNEGYDVGMSPDGPRGPYHSIADGVVAMSQKTGKRIIPMRVVYHKYWELKTWDRFRIPKPFSRIDFYALDGFVVTDSMNLDEAKTLLKKELEKEL